MRLLSDEELGRLLPSETAAFPGPLPTQCVSSDEFLPVPQTERQRRVEERIKELAATEAKRHGMTRRRFLQTASGMAAAFLAMNEVYGPLYGVSRAEATTLELASDRAKSLKDQFVMDCHTHFLRDDTRIMTFVRAREGVGKAGWNPALVNKPQEVQLQAPRPGRRPGEERDPRREQRAPLQVRAAVGPSPPIASPR